MWDVYLNEGLKTIEYQKTENESNFNRPPADSDKLRMYIGGTELIEITHPVSNQNDNNLYVKKNTYLQLFLLIVLHLLF